MLRLQMEQDRGELVLNAFVNSKKTDYAPHRFGGVVYADCELEVSEDRVMLRTSVLAKIIDCLLKLEKPISDVLVIGDPTGYTASIFVKIFDRCTIATIRPSEQLELEKKYRDGNVISITDVTDNFDVIFFDAGFYEKSVIAKFTKLLKGNGCLVYLAKDVATTMFSEKKFDFCDVNIILLMKRKKTVLFKKNLFLCTETLIIYN